MCVTILWGVSFPLVGEVAAGRPLGLLLVFLALRFSLATLCFLPFLRPLLRASAGRGVRPWLDAGRIAALLFGGFLLQTMGLVHTTPSRSAFVTMLSVPMVPFLAALWHRRGPSRTHVLASLVALVGVGGVLSPGGRLAPNLGDALTLAAALFFALEILLLERLTRRSPVLVLAVGQIAGVALLSLAALAWLRPALPSEWPGLGRGVVVTGILCTSLALGLMTFGQARVRAEVAALVFALEPVFASLFELAWTGRGMSPVQWGGAALVVAAVAASARAPVPGGDGTGAPRGP